MKLKEYVNNVHNGSITTAAKELGITRRMLYLYLQKKSIPVRTRVLKTLKRHSIEGPTL